MGVKTIECIDDNQLGSKGWKKGFLTLASGQTVSLVGSSAVQFSVWWLASETGSPLIMSLAGMFAFLPQVLLGPFAGAWVDRLSRKTVIIWSDLFIGFVSAGFALSFLFLSPPYWLACVVLGVRSVGTVFHLPAIQAAVPMIVPKDELIRANGWQQFMQSGAFIFGPVLGAAMYAALPLPVILLSDLVGAVVASIATAVVEIPELKHLRQTGVNITGEIKEGVTIFLSDKKLSIVTIATALCMVFFMPLSSFYLLMASDYFKTTAWHASITQVGYSVGMMLGAIIAGSLGKIKNKLAAAHIGLFVLGLSSLFCGTLPQSISGFWIFALLCLTMGSSVNLYNIPYIAYMQENIPQEAQGRAFSLMGSLFSITMPIGLLIAGPVAEGYGVSLWFLVAGIVMSIITALSLLAIMPKRKSKGENYA